MNEVFRANAAINRELERMSAKPVIIVSDRHLRDIAHEAWDALVELTFPPPCFKEGG